MSRVVPPRGWTGPDPGSWGWGLGGAWRGTRAAEYKTPTRDHCRCVLNEAEVSVTDRRSRAPVSRKAHVDVRVPRRSRVPPQNKRALSCHATRGAGSGAGRP